jgi:aminopeptidase N
MEQACPTLSFPFLPFKTFLSIFLFLFYKSVSGQDLPTTYDTLRGALNPLRCSYDVHFYDLQLKISVTEKTISGKNTIYIKALRQTASIQIDLFQNLSLDSIAFCNQKLSFLRDSNIIFITFPSLLQKDSLYFFTVYYHGAPIVAANPPWQGGLIWKEDSLGRPWIGVTCEGAGASLWWPNKDNLSDEPDSMSMSFTVPSDLFCVSNGVLRRIDKKPDGYSCYEWFTHAPINNYNVTFNIGAYASFEDVFVNHNDTLLLDYYVLDYHLPKAPQHFSQVKKILSCYAKKFGPYPFPKDGYALVETPYWGMEHQSAISYGNNYKNDVMDFDFIIIHESAHEWWGNSLSMEDRGEMWIHEAFATYAEALLLEYSYNQAVAVKYLESQKLKIQNKLAILGPLGVNYNGWPDADMYYKGAWMLHTLRNVINNDSLWFTILYGLATEFRHKNVTTSIIVEYISKKATKNLTSFFNQYLCYPSPPIFEYEFRKKTNSDWELFYRWKTDDGKFDMPLIIEMDRRKINIFPVTRWQKSAFVIHDPSTFRLAPGKFYIECRQIK